jgi:hypothetical protein
MSSAPPSPALPAPPPSGAAARVFAVVGRHARRLFDVTLNWPGGRWPVPTVTSLFVIAALLVAGVELLPKWLSDVTLTVRARTEVLELTLQPERTYVWWLPRGAYSLLTAADGPGCEQRSRFDVVCSSDEPTIITIKNGATVRFELATLEGAPEPSFTVEVTPRAVEGAQASSSFEVRNAADEPLLATSELVTFESQPVEHWRIPLIVERVEIGESLTDSVVASDAVGTIVRQPIMTEGDVRIFARALWFDERYQIKEERFDPADVVQIPADPSDDGLLLGLLSLVNEEDDGGSQFEVTLHTEIFEVFVRRLGGGHRIGVSMWAIVSNLPFWLALWVVWVSLIIVANYYSDRLGELRGHKKDG